MRICYIADGRSMHFHRWISFITERGHEVHFVSYLPVEPHHVEEIRKAGGVYHGQLGPFYIKRFWRTARDLRWLVNLLRREKIDVLHTHFLSVNAWYATLSNFHPLVVTVMGGDICGPDWRPRGVRESLLSTLALRRADLVTSWSYQMVKAIRRYSRKLTPVEVVHGGVNLKRFHPAQRPTYLLDRWGLPRDARVVLSPRIMWPLYNIDRVAEAAVRVGRARSDTYFLFAYPATDEAYEGRVREILSGAGADRVRFVGPVPHEEMADYYRLADVTVSIPRTDGTPMSVLESMACGTPVVVGDIADYDPHYIEAGKTVIATGVEDGEDIAAALLRLLEEPALAERLAAEARRRVETDGSYEAQMSRMEQLYRELHRAGAAAP